MNISDLRRTPRRRVTALAAVLGAAAAAVTTVTLAEPASALPIGQATCTLSNLTISPATGWFPLTSARSVTPGVEGEAKVEAVADVAVDAGAEVRIGWSVNNQTPQESFFGPANFADHLEFAQTRSTFGLIFVGAGTTSVQPFVRLVGGTDKRAGLLNRCFTVEALTR
ncbi:hypothetical protein [Amycolatopsis sp. NPDC004378]